jgi:hypothetical protein
MKKLHVYQLQLEGDRTATQEGTSGLDAAFRYANTHPGEIVRGWRWNRADQPTT